MESTRYSTKVITYSFLLLLLLLSPIYLLSSSTYAHSIFRNWTGLLSNEPNNSSNVSSLLTSKLRDSITFLPLKDLRFVKTPMEGHTWFMSSLNDTYMANEAEYLSFPSQATHGRLLCIKGRSRNDGTKNYYALAWPEALPESAIFLKGLTFVSDTYYDYTNLWHGLCAMAPFVGWSMRNGCLKPSRWVLFHWGEVRDRMGSWLQQLMEIGFGEVPVETFNGRDDSEPYCFERAILMRHNEGRMGREKRRRVFDLLRCKTRRFCGIDPAGKGNDANEKGGPFIRFTLLMRRGSRSFKNATTVTEIFSRECARVQGCIFKVAQSEDLSFCDQVRVMTDTDIVASPHGAQLTNMIFMDRNSSVMEFFPNGWLELAGVGQYAHHWMADQSGMQHRGAWWDPHGEKECPDPGQKSRCFSFYKDGKVGHNETYFAEWSRDVLNHVRLSKLEENRKNTTNAHSSNCVC
ncbi:hypothetical protein ACFE04_025658 [Oxalis oulophora]